VNRRLASLLFLAALLAPAPASALALGASPDSATRASWTLANGLTVIAQHVPGSGAVSITVGCHGGTDSDPAGKEGLAQLVGEILYTGAAGTTPERSRAEMSSLRPLGAELKVNRRQTLITEVASLQQFPGVFHQMAERMRGVRVTPASIATALTSLRAFQRDAYLDAPARRLYNGVAVLAAGGDSVTLQRVATCSALAGVPAADVEARLRHVMAPANAVLSIAGNLDGVNLRALVEHEFGSIPAGARAEEPPHRPYKAGTVLIHQPGLDGPVGCVGVVAPSLQQQMQPTFYLSLLVLATQLNTVWGPPEAPLTSHFQYSIMDDPELVRFYPALDKRDRTPGALTESFNGALRPFYELVADEDLLESLRNGVEWMLGAPVPPEMLSRFRQIPGLLALLSSTGASRELWGGEAVWAPYRAQFEKTSIDAVGLMALIGDARAQSRILLVP